MAHIGSTTASSNPNRNRNIIGPTGEQLSEMDGSGGWLHTNVFAGGKLLATYGGTDTYFALTDWLGTKRVETDSAGNTVSTSYSLPFGDNLVVNGGPDATEHHFTGKEHDSNTGNDYFLARYYNSATGRFLSPDWSAQATPVPYATMSDPQSLNLYSYMRNNPLGGVDADGHYGDALAEAVVDEVEEYLVSHPGAVDAIAGPLVESVSGSGESSVLGSALGIGTGVAGGIVASMVNPSTVSAGDKPTEDKAPETEPKTSSSGAGARKGRNGTIYKVPGSATRSGKPYIGRHNKPNPAKTRKSKDGRDRSQAEVVDTYNASDTAEGRQKEQQQIDAHGGVKELDNKRNEIKKTPQ